MLHLGGSKGPLESAVELEHSLTAIEHLKAFAHPLGMKVLLENLHNEVATPEHLMEVLKLGHFSTVGVCLDVGHAHLSDEGIEGAFAVLKGRIAELHLHDNAASMRRSAMVRATSIFGLIGRGRLGCGGEADG